MSHRLNASQIRLARIEDRIIILTNTLINRYVRQGFSREDARVWAEEAGQAVYDAAVENGELDAK